MKARTDEEFQVLSKLHTPEGLRCQGGYSITRICIGPQCSKRSLICDGKECSVCSDEQHQMCPFIKLTTITKLLDKRATHQKDFIQRVDEIEGKCIENIYTSWIQTKKKYCLGDLEEKYLSVVEQIYRKGDSEFLKGKEAQDFYKRLMKPDGPTKEQEELLLNHFQNSMEKLVNQIITLKKDLYQSFVRAVDIPKKDDILFDSQIIKRPFSQNICQIKNYGSILTIHSKSLLQELVAEEIDFIKISLMNSKSLDLIFRASENEFSATKFHQKCDKIPNTLTIVKTEHGRTIAGFTQHPWTNPSKPEYVSDPGRQSFLLSIDLKEKYVPQSSNTIRCGMNDGPVFGGPNGCDLYIGSNCYNNKWSAAYFSCYYNREDHFYKNNEQSYRSIAGSLNFRVLEYEVFRVQYYY